MSSVFSCQENAFKWSKYQLPCAAVYIYLVFYCSFAAKRLIFSLIPSVRTLMITLGNNFPNCGYQCTAVFAVFIPVRFKVIKLLCEALMMFLFIFGPVWLHAPSILIPNPDDSLVSKAACAFAQLINRRTQPLRLQANVPQWQRAKESVGYESIVVGRWNCLKVASQRADISDGPALNT